MAAFVTGPVLFNQKQTNRFNKSVSPARLTICATAMSRRTMLRLSVAVAASMVAPLSRFDMATAATTTPSLGEKVENKIYGYSFRAPPSGWSKQLATLSSARIATIFIRDEDGDSNINMVSTPVSGDFTKLSSFGSIDNVQNTIIPPKKKDIEGELISSYTDVSKNAYVFEYTVNSRGVKRHLLTVFSLQPGQNLLTLTGQAKEETWPEVESTIRAVIDSYELKLAD